MKWTGLPSEVINQYNLKKKPLKQQTSLMLMQHSTNCVCKEKMTIFYIFKWKLVTMHTIAYNLLHEKLAWLLTHPFFQLHGFPHYHGSSSLLRPPWKGPHYSSHDYVGVELENLSPVHQPCCSLKLKVR